MKPRELKELAESLTPILPMIFIKSLQSGEHGFRSKRSCESQLIEFIDDITTYMAAGKQTDALIIDFTEAFDKVSHILLIHKLRHYWIQGNVNNWIASFLTKRTQAAVVDGEMSNYVSVDSGVHK
ncbi:uncharacterized protein LOC134235250, partial [Saccostrea cucullata]|uniref:uncharacterized protein LOC134235250 n=1 Tax=Saccostrea cuccullata TaxID=36930 RepID=UPI002ED1120A